MTTIKIYNNIAQEGLSLLEKENYDLQAQDNFEGILLRSESLLKHEFPQDLLGIARAGAGTNNIPVQRCTNEGIVVFNTPGANANAVKELILATLLLSVRPVLRARDWILNLDSEDPEGDSEKFKSQFAGVELEGKTLGVIGLGAIGAMVANDAYRLGMNVIGYDPYVSVETAWNISRRVKRADDLQEVFDNCDFITIHVPLLDSTRHLISKKQLTAMKDTAVLLNFARKELVDTDAVINALDEGQIKSYVCDFADARLIHREDCIVLPHLGASTQEAEVNCAISAAKTLSRFLNTGEIVNSVNFPRVELTLRSPMRFTFIHKNIPNMLGQISTVAANHKLNIENMINKSRGDYAYTIVDIQDIPTEQHQHVIDSLSQIDHMIKVRLIENKTAHF